MNRKENAELNKYEYENSEIVLKSRPRVLFLELTRNCNMHCTMCRPYNWFRSDWFMKDEVLNKVKKELFPYVEMVDLRGFGESTLDNRLINLANELKENSVKTMIFTNMNAQEENYWKELIKTGINIAVSIETANPVKYEGIRRGGNFERLKKNLLSAVEEASDINVPYFTVVLSDSNLHDIRGLVDFAKECGVNKIQLNPISKENPKDPYGICTYGFNKISKEEAEKEFEQVLESAYKKNITIEVAANLFNENNIIKPKCLHPWSYVFVKYDGEVGFCDHLARVDASLKGSLLDCDFMDIWNGLKYQNLRKAHLEHNYEEVEKQGIECRWCEKNRYGNCENIIDNNFNAIDLSEYFNLNLCLPKEKIKL